MMLRLRRPSWWAVALTLVGVLIFVRLGIWQLRRADYKEHLLHLFSSAASEPVVPFATVEHGVSSRSYPHVSVHGHFLRGREYLLDDQIHASRHGVEVYAPFVVTNGDRLLLVDMGFLPRSRTDALPQLPPLKAGNIDLKGLYAKPPSPGLKLGGNRLPDQHSWPKLSIYISLADIGADLGRHFYPRVLLTDPGPAQVYLRHWVPDTMPPVRHRAYAFQWFTFAAASIAIFLILHRGRTEKKRRPHE